MQLKKYSQNVLVYTWILFLFLADEIICFSIPPPVLPSAIIRVGCAGAGKCFRVVAKAEYDHENALCPVPIPMLHGRWVAFTFKMCTISIRKFIYLISGACLINIYTALWRSYIDCWQPSSHSSYRSQLYAQNRHRHSMVSRLPVCHKIGYNYLFHSFGVFMKIMYAWTRWACANIRISWTCNLATPW